MAALLSTLASCNPSRLLVSCLSRLVSSIFHMEVTVCQCTWSFMQVSEAIAPSPQPLNSFPCPAMMTSETAQQSWSSTESATINGTSPFPFPSYGDRSSSRLLPLLLLGHQIRHIEQTIHDLRRGAPLLLWLRQCHLNPRLRAPSQSPMPLMRLSALYQIMTAPTVVSVASA